MSKTYKDSPSRKATQKGRERNISVRAVRVSRRICGSCPAR
jgi:hypothetical protein